MGKIFEALEKALPEGLEKEPSVDGGQETPASPPPLFDRNGNVNVFDSATSPAQKESPRSLEWDERLAIASSPDSPIAESFKRLRSAVLYPHDRIPPKSILVTSVAPSEGKGFVSANLGVTMAQSLEKYALLVDCDLRRPTLAAIFGLANDPGLTQYLQDGVDIAQLIQHTSIDKLSILSSGAPPANPAELIDSTRMLRLINELKDRYADRFIIIDTPPSVVASETAILAKQVDGVIIVVKWGGARRELVKQLVDTIGKDKIIGLVFNGFKTSCLDSVLKSYAYQGYGYKGYYGASKPRDKK